MSDNTNEGGYGFKNSRIDLTQLGDDNWNKSFTGKPAAQGGPRKRATRAPGVDDSHQPVSLDELFESRVRAATSERAVNQNRGQSRIWLFAGGLFLASVSGIAAAYYLVGSPLAVSDYAPDIAESRALETTSLVAENNVEEKTSSHFQGVTMASTVAAPASTPIAATGSTDSNPDTSLSVPPPADTQSAGEAVLREPIAPQPDVPAPPTEVATIALSEQKPETDQVVEPEVKQAQDASSEPETAETETERMVHIVPTAVTGESETKTNVNVSKAPAAPRKTIGQWLSVPADTELAAPSSVAVAATSQESAKATPGGETVRTQQELFKSFQDYLESTGQADNIDHPDQKALFNKFILWSVEAPVEN